MTDTRRRLDPEARRNELIQFGRDHFACHAYDALSVDEIAARAAVSKGTIYNYFGGRRGFYLATIREVVDALLAAIVPPPDASLATVLPVITNAFVSYAANNSGIYLALVRGGLGADAEVGELLERVRVTAAQHVFDALGLAAPGTKLVLAVSGWVAFVEATTAHWLIEGGLESDELADIYTRNLLALLEICA